MVFTRAVRIPESGQASFGIRYCTVGQSLQWDTLSLLMSSGVCGEKSHTTLLVRYAVLSKDGNVGERKTKASLQISRCAICQKRGLDCGGGSYTCMW